MKKSVLAVLVAMLAVVAGVGQPIGDAGRGAARTGDLGALAASLHVGTLIHSAAG